MRPFNQLLSSPTALSQTVLSTGLMISSLLLYVPQCPAQESQSPLSQKQIHNFLTMERELEQDFETFFEEDLAEVTQAPDDVAQILLNLAQQSQTNTAVLWVIPRQTHLHLVLLRPGGQPIVRDLYHVPRSRLIPMVKAFQRDMSDQNTDPKASIAAQQLYNWIIAPYATTQLQPHQIDALVFCLGNGLRGLPIAALQDPQGRYLVETYSVTSIPAFNLIDSTYRPRTPGKILAAGASNFEQLSPLPAVPVELSTILNELQSPTIQGPRWKARSLLNKTFTLKKLKAQVSQQNFTIIHLATHAEFRSGKPQNSFIQLRDHRLSLAQMAEIPWPSTLDLLVLSACKTAIGNEDAELGFAGVALKSNIKSAIGSLWYVSDLGTLALMGEFYRQLIRSPTKAKALQKTQLKMLSGEIRYEGDRLHTSRGTVPLPKDLAHSGDIDFTHPYFWAGFTLISSPW